MTYQDNSQIYLTNFLLSYLVVGKPLNNIITTMFPNLAWVFNVVLFLPLIIMVFNYKRNTINEYSVDPLFVLFFIIYYLWCFSYRIEGFAIADDQLLSVPSSIKFAEKFLYIVALLILSRSFLNNINVRLFIFISFFICTIPSVLYILLIGVDVLQLYSNDSFESQFVGLLTLGYSNSMILIVAVIFHDKLFPSNKLLNLLLLLIVLTCATYILIVCTKRGPIFWTIISIISVYYYKIKNNRKFLISFLFICIILLLIGEELLSIIEVIAPMSATRIKSTIYEGDTANRLDGKGGNNIFLLAYEQFCGSPLFGSYYRLLHSSFKGIYPHNLFLEILITTGIVGFIPFICLLIKTHLRLKRIFRSGQYSDIMLLILCIFLSTFTTLMTTGSLLLNNSFWLSFLLIILITRNNENSIYSLS